MIASHVGKKSELRQSHLGSVGSSATSGSSASLGGTGTGHSSGTSAAFSGSAGSKGLAPSSGPVHHISPLGMGSVGSLAGHQSIPPGLDIFNPNFLKGILPYGIDQKSLEKFQADLTRSLPHIYGSADSYQRLLHAFSDISPQELYPTVAAATGKEKVSTSAPSSGVTTKDERKPLEQRDLKAQLARYHSSHLLRSFRMLRNEEYGLDTIILCDGGHVKAHCCILACVSPFLKKVLAEAKDFPAVLSLPGVALSTMELLISCIYYGSVPNSVDVTEIVDVADHLGMATLVAVFRRSDQASAAPTTTKSSLKQEAAGNAAPDSARDFITEAKAAASSSSSSGINSGQDLSRKGNRLDQLLYKKFSNGSYHSSDSQDANKHIADSLVPNHDGKFDDSFGAYNNNKDLNHNRSTIPLNLSTSSKSCGSTSSTGNASHSSQKTASADWNSYYSSLAALPPLISANYGSSSLHSNPGIISSALNLPGIGILPGNLSNIISPFPHPTNLNPIINTPFTSLSSLNFSPASSVSTQIVSQSSSQSVHTSSQSIPKSKNGNSLTHNHRSANKYNSKSLYSSSKMPTSVSTTDRSAASSHLSIMNSLKQPLLTPQLLQDVYDQLKHNPQLAAALANIAPVPNILNLGKPSNINPLQSFQDLFPNLFTTSSKIPNTSSASGTSSNKERVQTSSQCLLDLRTPVSNSGAMDHESGPALNLTNKSQSKQDSVTNNRDSNSDIAKVQNKELNKSDQFESPSEMDTAEDGVSKSSNSSKNFVEKQSCLSGGEDKHLKDNAEGMEIVKVLSNDDSKLMGPTENFLDPDTTRNDDRAGRTQSPANSLSMADPSISHLKELELTLPSAMPTSETESAIIKESQQEASDSTTIMDLSPTGMKETTPKSVDKYLDKNRAISPLTETVDADNESKENDSTPADTIASSSTEVEENSSQSTAVASGVPCSVVQEDFASGSMTPEIDVVGSPLPDTSQNLKSNQFFPTSLASDPANPLLSSLPKSPKAAGPGPDETEVLDPSRPNSTGQPETQSNQLKKLFQIGNMGRKRKGCGDCDGCQVVEDCGGCRFCRDKAKFGGPNRLKQVCAYKRCLLLDAENDDARKKKKTLHRRRLGRCGSCDGCRRDSDCGECYACLHNATLQIPSRRKVCEMRICEQQQMDELRASLSAPEEPSPSPYSTDSLLAEGVVMVGGGSRTSSPTGDTAKSKSKSGRKNSKRHSATMGNISPSKVRTKYYCGECPGCLTTTPCASCLYCEDMPKFGGPGRYRQKCVKQLCVYHPRLQALKLSNRGKIPLEDLHHDASLHPPLLSPSSSSDDIDGKLRARNQAFDLVSPDILLGQGAQEVSSVTDNFIRNVHFASYNPAAATLLTPSTSQAHCWNPYLIPQSQPGVLGPMDSNESTSARLAPNNPEIHQQLAHSASVSPNYKYPKNLESLYANYSNSNISANKEILPESKVSDLKAHKPLRDLPNMSKMDHSANVLQVTSNSGVESISSHDSEQPLRLTISSDDKRKSDAERSMKIAPNKQNNPNVKEDNSYPHELDNAKPENSNDGGIFTPGGTETVAEDLRVSPKSIDHENNSSKNPESISNGNSTSPDQVSSISSPDQPQANSGSTTTHSSHIPASHTPIFTGMRGRPKGRGNKLPPVPRPREVPYRGRGRGRPRVAGFNSVAARKSERKKTFRYSQNLKDDSDGEDGEIFLVNRTVDNWWGLLEQKKEETEVDAEIKRSESDSPVADSEKENDSSNHPDAENDSDRVSSPNINENPPKYPLCAGESAGERCLVPRDKIDDESNLSDSDKSTLVHSTVDDVRDKADPEKSFHRGRYSKLRESNTIVNDSTSLDPSNVSSSGVSETPSTLSPKLGPSADAETATDHSLVNRPNLAAVVDSTSKVAISRSASLSNHADTQTQSRDSF